MLAGSMAALLAPVLAQAQTPQMPQTPAEIGQPIAELYAALEKIMRAGKTTSFRQRLDTLAPAIDKVFDLETILRVSVGLSWPTIDEATRVALATAFRRFTIATYVANFDGFDGERFEVSPDPKASGADWIVMSRIIFPSGDPARMDYLMRRGAAGWRIVDVLLDGTISRVAVQRSDFRGLLARGNAGALVESLNRKTVDLSGGA